jgi:cytochrome c peroxidase
MAGTGLTPAELDALAAFVDSLRPISSPRRTPDGALTTSAMSGAAVFQAAGCTSCHAPAARFTDRQLHDVGTGAAVLGVREIEGPRFKTPSLRELWLTAPYLHDGRAATLRDAIAMHALTALSAAQLADLDAFLLQLPLSDDEAARLFPR